MPITGAQHVPDHLRWIPVAVTVLLLPDLLVRVTVIMLRLLPLCPLPKMVVLRVRSNPRRLLHAHTALQRLHP
jgi:hypothetical protein